MLASIATDLCGVDRLWRRRSPRGCERSAPAPYLDAQRVLLIADVMTTGVSKARLTLVDCIETVGELALGRPRVACLFPYRRNVQ